MPLKNRQIGEGLTNMLNAWRRGWIRRYSTARGTGGGGASARTTSNLQKPAFAVRDIIAQPEAYTESVRSRGVRLYNNQSIDDVVSQYALLRKLQQQRQHAATEQNRIGKEIKARLSKSGMRDAVPSEQLREQSARAKSERARIEQELNNVDEQLMALLDSVPNLVAPDAIAVPKGEDYVVVDRFGGPLEQEIQDKSRDHVAIGLERGLLDIESASRVSGTGNIYLTGQGARLEQALIAHALDRCTSFGFKIVSPPTLIRPEFLAACGFRPRGDDEDTHIYEIPEPHLCLSGTAEIPLVCQNAQRQLSSEELSEHEQLTHCAVSRCFRREAGSRGADTRGLYRLHEFTKVEMVAWTLSTKSDSMLAKLVNFQREIFEEVLADVGTPLRVINVAPHDLGAPAYQKYDMEAWMPGRGSWGEISSASNCRDFQARRLHTTDAAGNYVHTLNGTALAVPRVILAIIENGWNPETRTISVPRVLQKYMGSDHI